MDLFRRKLNGNNCNGNFTHIIKDGEDWLGIYNLTPKTYLEMQLYKKLIFYKTFDDVVDTLPSHITHIEFGDDFNKPVNNLPSNLVFLEFGIKFDQPIDNLPITLKSLSLGALFCQSLNNLPPNLETLYIHSIFNLDYINNLPNSIKKLYLGYNYGQLISKLPDSLTDLIIWNDYPFLEELKLLIQNDEMKYGKKIKLKIIG